MEPTRKGEAHKAAFDVWWHEEGSGMPPLPGEDAETHVHRISRIAWENGGYKATEMVLKVAIECNCRAEHGAEGAEHLLEIEKMLRNIV